MKANKYICMIACLAVAINPLSVSTAQDSQEDERPSSDKISLDLKNVDIVELLRIVSLKTGKTIVPSKEVSGRITVYLSNVAFNDVLDIILLTQGLALNKKDNVFYVMTDAEYKKIFGRDYVDQRKIETVKLSYAKPAIVFNALSQLKSEVGKIVVDETTGTIILIDIPEKLEFLKKAIKELDQPLETTVFDLNYTKSSDAKTQLNAAITPGTGEVIIDERSGKAFVTDLPKKMDKLQMLVRELDEESRQVYVEADIIELTLSDEFERGIDWEKIWTSAAMDGLTFAGYFPASLTAAYQQIGVGTLDVNHYSAVIQFLNTYGKTNVISQPRIAVVNNEEANIMVGVREAYITQTQSQATSTTVTSESVEFVDVGVKLKIVPRIGADGFITMKLKPEVSSVKETITTELGSRIPIVQTSQSETVVKVKDGTMIMIAGMTKTEDIDTIKGWPILSKIPWLGIFFSYRSKSLTKTEVIIFLTPHLISGKLGLRGHDISKIIPMEHLPDNLKDKVVRDESIDKSLFKTEDEQAEKLAPKKPVAAAAVSPVLSASMAKETAKDYYRKGLNAQAVSNIKDAESYFVKSIELDNKFAAAFNSLGVIYEQKGKSDKAEEMYKKAILVDAHCAPAYSNLALFNESRNDYEKALEYWRKRVLYGNPNDDWTRKAAERVVELGG
ncbi:MAG: secretin N-terminal domain-containing protein [Candidatus Omnitrophota bacterium]|jgi:MSHA biogenesis protein MshL